MRITSKTCPRFPLGGSPTCTLAALSGCFLILFLFLLTLPGLHCLTPHLTLHLSTSTPATQPGSADDDLSNFDSTAAWNQFTGPEQIHTLFFLRSLATSIPDLQTHWTGDNYCGWTEIHCRGGGVVVDLAEVRIQSGTATLPELAADVDGAVVAVTHLYLYHQGARLGGTLPRSWATLQRLQSLLLIDNALTGTLPEEWGTAGRMTALQSLMLSLNAFSGTLPAAWSSLKGLKTVVLSNCGLTGSLPPAWGDLPLLFLADVSGNRLCGCGPETWRTKRTLDLIVDAVVTAANCSAANACTSSSETEKQDEKL